MWAPEGPVNGMADLHNTTPGLVELVPLIDRHGANVMVLIAKVTYEIHARDAMTIAPEQDPLTFADVTTPSTAGHGLVLASDITDFKPSTDVVVTPPAGALEDCPAAGREIDIQIGLVRFGGRVAAPWPFGPVSRATKPRKDYIGTYDRAWLDERCPLLPTDFDPRHNQVAPSHQVAPRPLIGDERVTIRNLYAPDDTLSAALPGRTVVVSASIRGRYFTEIATLDTVTLSADRPRLALVWRLAIKTRQKIEEVRNVFASLALIRSTRELYNRP